MKKIAQGRARRQQRQKEAVERNIAYRALSLKERVEVVAGRIVTRGGQSKRERARLTRLVAEAGMDIPADAAVRVERTMRAAASKAEGRRRKKLQQEASA